MGMIGQVGAVETLMDSTYFTWLDEPGIMAMMAIFALIYGTASAALFFFTLQWTKDMLNLIEIEVDTEQRAKDEAFWRGEPVE